MDLKLFQPLKSSILNDRSFGILIADLTEVKDKMLRLLKLTGESFKPLFDTELVQLDTMQLAKYNNSEIAKLEYLLILCTFFCEEKDTFIDKIDKLNEDNQSDIYSVLKYFVPIEETDEIRNSIRGTIHRKTTNDQTEHFLSRIKDLEEQLAKESENRSLAMKLQNELDEQTIASLDYQNQLRSKELELDLIKAELKGYKEKTQQFHADTKAIDEIKASMKEYELKANAKEKESKELKETFITQENGYLDQIAQLTRKVEINKEREIMILDLQSKYDRLNKELGLQREKSNQYDQLNQQYQELKTAIETNTTIPMSQASKSEIERLKAIVSDQEKVIKETYKKVNQYEIQLKYLNKQLNEGENKEVIIKGQTTTPSLLFINTVTNQGNKEEINYLNVKITELTNELKQSNEVKNNISSLYKKNMSEMQAKYEKEFELISSAMYHLGFKFWSMKKDYETQLSINPNWLIKERQRFLNGDS